MKKNTNKRLSLFLVIAFFFIFAILGFAKYSTFTKADKKPSSTSDLLTVTAVTSAITPETTAVSNTSVFAVVTLEDAKDIALSHAGADSSSAIFTKEKLDKGVYELKFSDIYGKYEYEVAAANGTILDYKWEIKNLRSAIPLELVKEIALNHAGVDSANVKFSKEKLDETVYELKFSDENGKYEYKISAVDGTILDYNWDVRTLTGSASTMSEDYSFWEGKITREQASQIALDVAEVSRETLNYLVCYISWKNHVPTAYEVKFATRWATYHYTIDLDTGTILGSVCHPHH